MNSPFSEISDNESDPFVIWKEAHRAVQALAPRVHDAAVNALAKYLWEHGSIDESTLGILILESDPVGRHIRSSVITLPKRKP